LQGESTVQTAGKNGNPTRTRRWLIGGGLALAVLAVLAWAFAPRPLAVDLAEATVGRFETTIDEDARTRLAERYVVSAPLAGRLARITLQEGDAVTAGQVVARLAPALPPLLDPRTARELAARVEAAQALVQRALARIERARIGLQQANNDLLRTQQLAQQGFVAPTRLDADALSVKAAQRDLDAAVQEHRAAQQDLAQARAARDVVAQPGQGADFEVRAPAAGRVLRIVQESEGMVALGAPLLELGDTARLEIVAELLTTDALQAPPGARVVVERWGGAGLLEGRVRRVEPAAFTKVSALGVEEQRVRVRIDLTSPPAQWAALGDGFRVGVRIVTLERGDALRVPVSAVFPAPGGEAGAMAVFAVVDGRARQQAVTLGGRNGRDAWISAGLRAGDRVIAYPPPAVRDGVRVTERRPE
jgi:HlyD family secretion protein